MEFSKNAPNGGFPSIYVIETEDVEKETPVNKKQKGKKKLEIQPPEKVVDIKTILAERRHITPFINLTPEQEDK